MVTRITQIKDAVAIGQLEVAVEELKSLIQSSDELGRYENEMLTLSGKLSDFKEKEALGILSQEQVSLERSRLMHGTLGLLNRIERKESPRGDETPAKQPNRRIIYALLGGLMLLVVGWWFIGGLAPSGADDLIIYLYQGNDQQDYYTDDTAELLLDLNGDRRTSKIGPNGRIVFSEVPLKFLRTNIPLQLKHPHYQIREEYAWTGKPIYARVDLREEMLTVRGGVLSLSGEKVISGANVMVNNRFQGVSDDKGMFSIQIPPDAGAIQYDITIRKEGYVPLNEFYFPASSNDFRLKPE